VKGKRASLDHLGHDEESVHGLGPLGQDLGRVSPAISPVCYCLAITNVDPTEIDLLFERFVAPERKEPPDIDVDFEHERREEVIQYIYARYGRDRAGIAATVVSFAGPSAVPPVGTALGLEEDDRLWQIEVAELIPLPEPPPARRRKRRLGHEWYRTPFLRRSELTDR